LICIYSGIFYIIINYLILGKYNRNKLFINKEIVLKIFLNKDNFEMTPVKENDLPKMARSRSPSPNQTLNKPPLLTRSQIEKKKYNNLFKISINKNIFNNISININ
jgi:hypothetical protein